MAGAHRANRAVDWKDSSVQRAWPPRLPRHRVLEPRSLDHAPGLGYAESVGITLDAIAQAAREARGRASE